MKNRILTALIFFCVAAVSAQGVISTLTYLDNRQQAQLIELEKLERQERIDRYVPLVMKSVTPSKPSYAVGEVIVATFELERFTNASSLLARSLRCNNGFELFEEFAIPGSPVGELEVTTEVFIVPKGAGGNCLISFGQKFEEIIEDTQVERTVNYAFNFKVEE